MSRGAKVGAFVVVAVVVVGALVMMGKSRGANRATEVRMEAAGRRDLVAAVTASGQVEAKSDVSLSSEVTARILKIHVKEGDMVTKDELVVELDQSQFKGAVDRAEATVAQANAASVQARANRDQARNNLNRIKELKRLQPTLTNDQDVENAQTAFDVADANLKSSDAILQQAKAGLKEAQDNLSRTLIYSPITGRVVRLAVEEGEVAVPGTFSKETGLLMRIADMSTILAKVKVDETDIVRITRGDSVSVTIDAWPDSVFHGRVTKIGNSAAAASTTGTSADKAVDFEVEVTLSDPPKDVRPDLSMTARIITSVRKQTLSVPIIALTARALPNTSGDAQAGAPIQPAPASVPGDTSKKKLKEQDGVFVVNNGIARFRPVKVGITGDEYVEILDGLKEGEVVVSGTYQAIRDMKDSTKVRQTTTPATEVKKP